MQFDPNRQKVNAQKKTTHKRTKQTNKQKVNVQKNRQKVSEWTLATERTNSSFLLLKTG